MMLLLLVVKLIPCCRHGVSTCVEESNVGDLRSVVELRVRKLTRPHTKLRMQHNIGSIEQIKGTKLFGMVYEYKR